VSFAAEKYEKRKKEEKISENIEEKENTRGNKIVKVRNNQKG
jgi:hypothetical protein